MSYTIKKSNGSFLVEVADNSVNTTATSVSLVGRGSKTYGLAFAENFVHLTENFANNISPSTPMQGQLWYDTSANIIKVYNGTGWIPVGSTFVNPENPSQTAGMVAILLPTTGGDIPVLVFLARGRVVSIISDVNISNTNLPATIKVNDITYAIKNRFLTGIKAGLTFAYTTDDSYVLHSNVKWGTARAIAFTGDVTGTFSLDGSADISTALSLNSTGVSPGTYSQVTVNAEGRVTAGAASTITLSGDATGTLTNTGAIAVSLAASGVSAGLYGGTVTIPTFRVDTKGRITTATDIAIRPASESQTGIVQLYSNVDSASQTLAATPKAVKTAYDKAVSALPKTGGTIAGDLTITGNLFVSGTTTTVSASQQTFVDPVITLGGVMSNGVMIGPPSDNNMDRGVAFWWHTGTAAKKGFFGFDDSTGYFTFIPDATETNNVLTGTAGSIKANLIGNADTATLANTLKTQSSMTISAGASGVTPNGSSRLFIEDDANVAIELGAPAAKTCYILFSDATGNAGSMRYEHASDKIVFRTNSADQMSINNTGDTHIYGNLIAESASGTWIANTVEAQAGTVTNKLMTPALSKALMKYDLITKVTMSSANPVNSIEFTELADDLSPYLELRFVVANMVINANSSFDIGLQARMKNTTDSTYSWITTNQGDVRYGYISDNAKGSFGYDTTASYGKLYTNSSGSPTCSSSGELVITGFNSNSLRYWSQMSGPTYSDYRTYYCSGFLEDRRSPWNYKYDGFRFITTSVTTWNNIVLSSATAVGAIIGGSIYLYGVRK